eukprot:6202697-Pleurochrysis_carterae.AAC.2
MHQEASKRRINYTVQHANMQACLRLRSHVSPPRACERGVSLLTGVDQNAPHDVGTYPPPFPSRFSTAVDQAQAGAIHSKLGYVISVPYLSYTEPPRQR